MQGLDTHCSSVQYNVWNAIALSLNMSAHNEIKAGTLSDVHLLTYTVFIVAGIFKTHC